jgi:hypothetical protein
MAIYTSITTRITWFTARGHARTTLKTSVVEGADKESNQSMDSRVHEVFSLTSSSLVLSVEHASKAKRRRATEWGEYTSRTNTKGLRGLCHWRTDRIWELTVVFQYYVPTFRTFSRI